MAMSRGERLKLLRKLKGVEQQQAAKAMGISGPYLSLLERDLKGKTLDQMWGTYERAAQFYEVITEYLTAETPQEYMQVWVQKVGTKAPATLGQRTKMVLTELGRLWGDTFSQEMVARGLGCTAEELRSILEDRTSVPDDLLAKLSRMTGVATEWLRWQDSAAPEPDPEVQRVVEYARARGVSADELMHLVDALASARARKPSG